MYCFSPLEINKKVERYIEQERYIQRKPTGHHLFNCGPSIIRFSGKKFMIKWIVSFRKNNNQADIIHQQYNVQQMKNTFRQFIA